MKASEVLRRYAAGERDFHRADLRGQSFKEQDLSGADFTEADIRGANFTHAILKRTNFTKAKAGLGSWWKINQFIIAMVVANFFSGLAASFNTHYIATYFSRESIEEYTVFPGVTVLFLIAFIFVLILREGLTARTASVTSFGLSFIVFVAVSVIFVETGVIAGAFVFAGTVVAIIAFASAISVAAIVTGFIPSAFKFSASSFSLASLSITPIITGVLFSINDGVSDTNQIPVNLGMVIVSVSINGLSLYVAWQALKGNEKFSWTSTFAILLSAIGGTSFCGANLTSSNFSDTILESTSFNQSRHKQTNLTQVQWEGAKQLDRARVGNSILLNPAVRELLVTRNGYKKSYVDANFRSANLDGVNLNEANLKWADLSEATLHYADLRGANLSETLVLGTDFKGASLTGACLEGWNIDHTTNLEGVDCQYVYLLRNQQERRPSSGDFAPGEFTKLFQEVLSTVDLIFRNGVDWKAFVTAFQQVQVENEDTPLEIQSIENKGDGVVVVRVSVPSDTNKEKIHSEFNQQYELALKALEARYQAELQAKDGEISRYREDSANMWEVIKLQAKKPIHVQAIAEAKTMNNSNDSSQTVNIGGNATGSTINLGTISGAVTNAINRLPETSDPDQPDLKQLLMQLKEAIEADPDLPDADKADLLEQVQNLAEAKQTEEPAQKEGLARKAKKMFEATLKSLPDTAKIVEACSKLLPLILKALGLPA